MQQQLQFVFTDGHAVNSLSNYYGPEDIERIEALIDKKAIMSKYWKDDADLDLKRRKEAEFLVLGDIPPQALQGFVVHNQSTAGQIQDMKGFGGKKLIVKPDYYF